MDAAARKRLDITAVACAPNWLLCPPIIDSATFADLTAVLKEIDRLQALVVELEERLDMAI